MKIIGYARVSTKEQSLDRQEENIRRYCSENGLKLYKDKVYCDQMTGKTMNRPAYQLVKEELLEPGDVLIVSELDRLGRTKQGITEELHFFTENKIRLISLDIPTTHMDLSKFDDEMCKSILNMINNVLLEVYSSIAETELIRKQKRQQEGIEAMKKRGDWDKYGRPRVMAEKEFMKEYKLVLDGHIRPFDLMRKLNMTKGTYYRYKKKADIKLGLDGAEGSIEEDNIDNINDLDDEELIEI